MLAPAAALGPSDGQPIAECLYEVDGTNRGEVIAVPEERRPIIGPEGTNPARALYWPNIDHLRQCGNQSIGVLPFTLDAGTIR